MTRLDWLELQLERSDLSLSDRAKFEVEAARLADDISKRQEREREAERERNAMVRRIQELYHTENFAALYQLHGHEFKNDYEILIEGEEHVVYSSVARDNQPSRWPCPSEQKAKSKLYQLVGYRIYDHYCRDYTSQPSTSPKTSRCRDFYNGIPKLTRVVIE